MMLEPLRIRDFIITRAGWIFAVASYDNKDAVHGFLRYTPDPTGERVMPDGTHYRKLGFREAQALMQSFGCYSRGLCAIPFEEISEVKHPREYIERNADAAVEQIVQVLERYGVSRRKMGVTGSRLVGLETETSDIDFVVYGTSSFARGRQALQQAIQSEDVKPIDMAMWHRIYRKRSPELSFDEFVLHEKRKWNRGTIGTTYFDLLFVREFGEISIEPQGTDNGYATIRAKVTGAKYAFDSPAIYKVEHGTVDEVLSYTHTYAGQALEDEVIEARGLCNEGDTTRLIVGTTREAQGEWIKSCTLLST
ncbi:MAG: nucleotidyltransferase domain-containing protein [Halobacteriota archaeon]